MPGGEEPTAAGGGPTRGSSRALRCVRLEEQRLGVHTRCTHHARSLGVWHVACRLMMDDKVKVLKEKFCAREPRGFLPPSGVTQKATSKTRERIARPSKQGRHGAGVSSGGHLCGCTADRTAARDPVGPAADARQGHRAGRAAERYTCIRKSGKSSGQGEGGNTACCDQQLHIGFGGLRAAAPSGGRCGHSPACSPVHPPPRRPTTTAQVTSPTIVSLPPRRSPAFAAASDAQGRWACILAAV